MRNFLTLFFALCLSALSAQWQSLNAPGVTGFVMLSEGDGQIFGLRQNGLLRRSPSNGIGWLATTPPPTSANAPLTAMEADDNILVAYTDTEAFLSINYGASWQQMDDLPGAGPIFVRDGNIYHFLPLNGLYRYDSALDDWSLILPSTTSTGTFAFLGNQIWAGLYGDNDLKYLSDAQDPLALWESIVTLPPFLIIVSIAVDNNLLVVATDAGVYSSADNGATTNWTVANLAGDLNMKISADGGAYYAIVNDQLHRSPDGLLPYQLIFSAPGEIFDVEAINSFWIASTRFGLYRSPEDPLGWVWVESGQAGLYQYQVLKSAGGVLFYSELQTAFSTDAGLSWQIVHDFHRFNDFLFHDGNWYAKDFNIATQVQKLWQSSNLTDWSFRSILPTDSTGRFWAYVGNAMVNTSAGAGAPIYVSMDDGQSWLPQGTSPGGTFFTYNDKLYCHQPGSDELLESSTLGFSWLSLGPVLAADPNVSAFLTLPGKVYAYSADNLLITTTSIGLPWVAQPLQTINPLQSPISGGVAYNNGLALLIDNTIYVTQNDGLSWTSDMTGYNATPASAMAALGNAVYSLDINGIPRKQDNFLVNPAQYAGQVYRDVNGNGMLDGGEALSNIALRLDNINQFTTSASNGTFSMFAETQSDFLTAFSPGQYCTFNPLNHPVNGTDTQLDFVLNCPSGITDVAVGIINNTPFRPGFETDISLTARNLGNDAATGTVTLSFDPMMVDFIDATPYTPEVGGMLTWMYNGLSSLDQASFVIRVKTKSSVSISTVLCFDAQITPAVDQNPLDNMAELCSTVIGSFDPNDKQVSPEILSPADVTVGKPLVYTVRFQNTGTYLASLVVIRDTLSPNLDPATLQVLSASHPFTWSLHGPGIVVFRFDGINLPDMTSDEPGSHGFIQFSVAPKANLPSGGMVPNTAHIYFDFNAPIVTNTVTSTVVGTNEPAEALGLTVQPNPTTGLCTVRFEQAVKGRGTLKLADAHGRLLQSVPVLPGTLEQRVDLGDLPPGTYFLWLEQSDGRRMVSKLEKR